jgi:hypothetical protein
MEGFFDLQSLEHLLRKLEREYDRWKADPLNVDLAWNFFVTAEHLPDWIYNQDFRTGGKERPDLLDGETPYIVKKKLAPPATRICWHLANGAKHFHLNDQNLTSVAGTRQQGGWVKPGWVSEGWVQFPALIVDRSPGEQKALSSTSASIGALSLATNVVAFWQARLS